MGEFDEKLPDGSGAVLLSAFDSSVKWRKSTSGVRGIGLMPPGAVFGPRELKDGLLLWIIECPAGSELLVDGARHAARANAFFVLRPGQRDELRFGPGTSSIHGFFHFQWTEPGEGWPPAEAWPMVRYEGEASVLPFLFRQLLHAAELPVQPGEAVVRAALHSFLTAFLTGETTMVGIPRVVFPPMVCEALRRLNTWAEVGGAAEKRGVADLARELGVDADHLSRRFKQAVGVGPAEYLTISRVERGASLLRDTDRTVEWVAEQCGFHDQSHFSRTFTRVMGMAPSEFRRAASLRVGAMRPAAALHFGYLRSMSRGRVHGLAERVSNDTLDEARVAETVAALVRTNAERFEGEAEAGAEECLDLRAIANRTGAAKTGWFGDLAPAVLPTGRVVLHGVTFELPERRVEETGFVLLGRDEGGRCAGAESVTLSAGGEGDGAWYVLCAAAYLAEKRLAVARFLTGGEPGGEDVGGVRMAGEGDVAGLCLTDWWPTYASLRSGRALPVFVPKPDGRSLACVLYVLRVPASAGGKLVIEAGERPFLILGATWRGRSVARKKRTNSRRV